MMKTPWIWIGLIIIALALLIVGTLRADENCITPDDVMGYIVNAHKDTPGYQVATETIQFIGATKLTFQRNSSHPAPTANGSVIVYAVVVPDGSTRGLAVDFDEGGCNALPDGTRTSEDVGVYAVGPTSMGLIMRAAGLSGD